MSYIPYTPGGGALPSGTVQSETALGQAPAAGAAVTYARGDHTHGTPSNATVASGNRTVFVYRPSTPPTLPNIYDNFALLYAALLLTAGDKVIVFDDAGVGLGNPIPVPAGVYDMVNVEWHGIFDGPHLNTGGSLVYLDDGVILTNLNRLDNLLRVYTASVSVSPITIPAAGFDTLKLAHGSFIAAGALGGTESFVTLGAGCNYWVYLEGCSILAGSVPTFDFGADDGFLHVQMLEDISFFNGNVLKGTNPSAQVTAETTAINTAIDRTQPAYAGTFEIKDVRLSMMSIWRWNDGATDPLPAGELSSWSDLMDALSNYRNDRVIEVEVNAKNGVVPTGTYDVTGLRFVTKGDVPGQREVSLNDASLIGFESHGQIDWINKNTTAPVITYTASVVFHRLFLRGGSKLLQHATATQPFMQIDAGATVFLDIGDNCVVDQNGGAVEAISNDGSLDITARDNAQITNQTIIATVNTFGHMIGPGSYISTNQSNAPFPLLTVDRSKPRLDWDYLEVTSSQTPVPDDLDKVYGYVCAGTMLQHDLPSAAVCKDRRTTVKIVDESGGTVQIRPNPGSNETIEGFRNVYVISNPGKPSITLQSDGISDWKIVATSDLREQALLQELIIPATAGWSRYYTPVGSMFFDAATETTLDIDTGGGFVPAVFGVDYDHQRRGFNRPTAPVSVLDAAIGFRLLAGPSGGGETYRFRWVERKILRTPESIMGVRLNGGGTPDYPTRWNISIAALGVVGSPTDGIHVPLPKGYSLELWRLSDRRGGDANSGVGNPGGPGGAGRRYVPYFRGATNALFVDFITTFTIHKKKQHFKACYYNALTGARSSLCAETLLHMSRPKNDDNLNSSGDSRYTRTKENATWVL